MIDLQQASEEPERRLGELVVITRCLLRRLAIPSDDGMCVTLDMTRKGLCCGPANFRPPVQEDGDGV